MGCKQQVGSKSASELPLEVVPVGNPARIAQTSSAARERAEQENR